MLIEHRTYTMRPGNVPAFLQAQAMRGFDPRTRPIMARLIGYFMTIAGPSDQLVHLWRFDSYDDWFTRLHGADPKREAYFKVVRPLMLAQESRFMVPAPVARLTPLWGNGQDWLPGDAPTGLAAETAVVEETTTQLLPGSLPAFWDAHRQHAGPDEGPAGSRFLGCFSTLVGAQHQVTTLRCHATLDAYGKAQQQSLEDQPSADLVQAISPLVVDRRTRLMRPVPVPAMSPLFRVASPGLPHG